MEWLQLVGLLLGSMAIGFAGFKLLRAGPRRTTSVSRVSSGPDELTLTAISNDRWKKSVSANAIAIPFLQRGFKDGGCYSLREPAGHIVRFLVQEEEAILLALFEDAQANHWVELATYFEDGTDWTYSNRDGDSSQHRPGCVRYFAPRLAPEALYGKLKLERVKKKPRKVTVNNADDEYATIWAAQQKWLKEGR